MFNADLALSVTMTAISTLLSVVMLPVNLVLYATSSYSSAVVKSLDWSALFISLIVVIGGISSGLICSAFYNSHRFNLFANKMGNFAGVALICYSATISSASHGASLWDKDAKFYIGVAAPALVGVSIATYMASRFNLDKPERVAVAVESCYQNTGIATSVAITMFKGEDLATAIGVPLYYGICEAVILAIYCMICWKIGWTKAPANENICVVIATSYEVEKARMEAPNAIEVVYNNDDLVFTQTIEGYKIDEDSLHERANADLGGHGLGTEGLADIPIGESLLGRHKSTIPNDASPVPAAGKTLD
jgi:predicted Na+-dependent transporter